MDVSQNHQVPPQASVVMMLCYITFSLAPNRSQSNLQMYKTIKVITTELYYHHYIIFVIKYQVLVYYIHCFKA